MAKFTKEDALNYHSEGRPGKIQVVPTTPYSTQRDLSLAYTPGVADPCKEIEKNPEDAYKYTAKGNLVAVISNGTAVLGLGDIGTLAGKPVMEGKGLLFKVFADVDVFDIELDTHDVEEIIRTVKIMAPTFGGINLEDIKAPECFEIETRLINELDIPVFHDDQHGTAIISGAGLLNALEMNGKKIEDIKIVVNGAGAGAISCTKLYISLGVKKENIFMFDSKGILHNGRNDLNDMKKLFAVDKDMSLEEALNGADMFLGLSVAGVLKPEMLKNMAKDPIVFALANPVPEIDYDLAIQTRDDIIMATGRSDYPNQINNVLGFPFIFRGALDVHARKINEEMKVAATMALAELAKQPVPEIVMAAYDEDKIQFGRNYIIPKPLDPRLITYVATAVAKAAIDTGVARRTIEDWDAYKIELKQRLGHDNALIRAIIDRAKKSPKRVVFADATNIKVLKAAQECINEGIANPILLGNVDKVNKIIEENALDLYGVPIIDYLSNDEESRREKFAQKYFELRNRKGITYGEALDKMYSRDYFGVMMVETGEADAYLSGISSKYRDTILPALEIVGTNNKLKHIAGMHIVMSKNGPVFFADTTVNTEFDARTLVDTTLLTARAVKMFGIEPKIALLSYSNFGSVREGSPEVVREAVEILHRDYPELIVDGDIQANFALDKKLRDNRFPFNKLKDKDVNTLIFPSLEAGNIAYKLMGQIGGSSITGPVLLGIGKPIQVLQIESSVREIVDMAAISVVDVQWNERKESFGDDFFK